MLAELRPEAVVRDGDRVELRIRIEPSLDVFPDHFPEYPMLPGVVQLGWAVRAAQRECGMPGELARLSGLKFMQPLRPGDRLTLRLEKLGAQDVAFSYVAGATVHSSGRLRFNAAAASPSLRPT
ncbi:hypothetical protein AAG565_14140 [Fontimonas sp. SYSU GA230001]|uniref:ApeI family dehydratase n=1 Tax=Fontimonas sp. SYSU GA230001 TaxID=3142450 RepID=UPI0032B4ACFC